MYSKCAQEDKNVSEGDVAGENQWEAAIAMCSNKVNFCGCGGEWACKN